MDASELRACLEVAQEAARRGGEVLQSWRQRISVREKARFDLVTEADLASQEAVQSHIHRYFPQHGFLGEEGGATPNSLFESDQPLWIVDPLDGTTNYVHQMPFYAVSIGLAVRQELLLGVIYDPSRSELFHGVRGQGAWLNRERLRTSGVRRLEDALLSTGFPPELHGQEHTLETWRYFSLRTRSLRRTGSTALNLAYVAAGRNDGYWTYQAFAWDAVAGIVLIREAGGCDSRLDGSPYDLAQQDVLCSNGPLHQVLLDGLRALQQAGK
jgi:myo-inositol-1(or 4)-monophosphatase